MTKRKEDLTSGMTEAELDTGFAQLRAAEPPITPDFMARILADAAEAMPAQPVMPTPKAPRRSFGFLDILGGWQGVGGLAASAFLGLWIGYAEPVSLDSFSSTDFTEDLQDEDPFAPFELEG